MGEPTLSSHHAAFQMKGLCRELLDLPVLPIQVEWAPRNEIGATGDAKVISGDRWGRSVRIRVANDLPPREAAATVAHEFRHVHQALQKPDAFFHTDGYEEWMEEDADAFEEKALRLYEEKHGALEEK